MASRKLYLLGEGTRDVGRVDVERRIDGPFEGDIPRLVRRLLIERGSNGGCGYVPVTIGEIVRAIPRTGRPTRTGTKSKDLRDAVLAILRNGDPPPFAIVAVIDARSDEIDDLERDVTTILSECERSGDIPVAIGLALHEIEIWMLSDQAAREAAFGAAVGAQPIPEPHEEIRDPKGLWLTLSGQSEPPNGVERATYEDDQRRSAWQSMRPSVVAHACRRGFGKFAIAIEPVMKALHPRGRS